MANFKCAKCLHPEYTSGEMRATGSFLQKLFDIQSRKFTTVSCKKCGYTEFYSRTSGGGNILDFLIG